MGEQHTLWVCHVTKVTLLFRSQWGANVNLGSGGFFMTNILSIGVSECGRAFHCNNGPNVTQTSVYDGPPGFTPVRGYI